eukprot:GHVT01098111.1.p1 GENE.GHVT01098111.1~~GHVT01098111.1.p1  ORF type:complete len:180 (-),score=24.07 GHVT01098111.1:637-1176(-)
MPDPYVWRVLRAASGSEPPVGRSGHTLVSTRRGLLCFGGTTNSSGNAADDLPPEPTADVLLFSIRPGGQYEWHSLFKDSPQDGSSSGSYPRGRTLHSCTATSPEEVFIFGGLSSSSPFTCLNDGWVLDISRPAFKPITWPKGGAELKDGTSPTNADQDTGPGGGATPAGLRELASRPSV